MMRRCDGTDPNLIAADRTSPCACGLAFDDVERMVLWPHLPVGPKLTDAELQAAAGELMPVVTGTFARYREARHGR